MALSLQDVHPVSKPELNEEQKSILSLSQFKNDTPVSISRFSATVDAFVLSDVLSTEESDFLVSQTEELEKYSFWDLKHDKPRKDFRDADTIECTHQMLADHLWERMKDHVNPNIIIDENHTYFEKELAGEWEAVGINPNLLFGRYKSGGHFAPHTDGCTVIDFNYRTLYTVLVYLNTCEGGGRTHLLKDEQLHDLALNEEGIFTCNEKYIIDSALPVKGSALVFYHAHCHEGEPVKNGCAKYFIRTDVLYKRKVPICNLPNDIEAYEMYLQAKEMSLAEPMEAMKIFRRAFKLSPSLAEIFSS